MRRPLAWRSRTRFAGGESWSTMSRCVGCPARAPKHLFGLASVADAFTGAVFERQGILELASDGTVFFDEIADMQPEVQGTDGAGIPLQRIARLRSGDGHRPNATNGIHRRGGIAYGCGGSDITSSSAAMSERNC